MGGKKPWDKKRIRLQEMLRTARFDAGLKQADLAKRIGADQSFVSRYERGERRLDLVELQGICEACGVKLSAFVAAFEAEQRSRRTAG